MKTKTKTETTNMIPKGYFKFKKDALEAAKIRCKEWGSNLVYLGWEPIEIDGQIYYKNSFNIYD